MDKRILLLCLLIGIGYGQNITISCLRNVDDFLGVLKIAENYYNVSQAINPSNGTTTASFIRIHLSYTLNDEIIETEIWTWTTSCLYTALASSVFPKISLATIYPDRSTTQLYITVPPVCPLLLNPDTIITEGLFQLQSLLTTTQDATQNTADCVCKCDTTNGPLLNTPARVTIKYMLLIAMIIGVIFGVSASSIAVTSFRDAGKSTDDSKPPPNMSQCYERPRFWFILLGGITCYFFILFFSCMLITEEWIFKGFSIGLIALSSIAFIVWISVFNYLAFQDKIISWKLWHFKSPAELRFLHAFATAVGLALAGFVLGFEITWTLLGLFLDPSWAIPLLTMYAVFVTNIIVWAEKVYNAAITFRNRIIAKIAVTVLKDILTDRFGHKVDDIYNFVVNNQSVLEALGFKLDDFLAEPPTAEADEKDKKAQ